MAVILCCSNCFELAHRESCESKHITPTSMGTAVVFHKFWYKGHSHCMFSLERSNMLTFIICCAFYTNIWLLQYFETFFPECQSMLILLGAQHLHICHDLWEPCEDTTIIDLHAQSCIAWGATFSALELRVLLAHSSARIKPGNDCFQLTTAVNFFCLFLTLQIILFWCNGDVKSLSNMLSPFTCQFCFVKLHAQEKKKALNDRLCLNSNLAELSYGTHTRELSLKKFELRITWMASYTTALHVVHRGAWVMFAGIFWLLAAAFDDYCTLLYLPCSTQQAVHWQWCTCCHW